MKSFLKPADLIVRLRVFFFPLLLIPACQTTSPPAPPSQPDIPAQSQYASPPKMNDQPGYIGLTKEAALTKAKALGVRARIVEEDGKSFPVTKDYRPERVNFTINDGKVTKLHKG